jgi:MYXO-CTERM domain-containing protein
MHRFFMSLLPLTALFAPLAWSGDAQAGIGACGNIHVEGEAQCEVKGGIECEAQCTPVSFEAQCAANLQVDCNGQCNLSADVECTGSCQADCEGQCEVSPAEFDCRGECVGSCEGDCSASCGADSSGAECRASCQANCEGHCSARCDVTPAMADCSGKCEASCEGRCQAEVNADCQVDCQADGYIDCKAELEGGCKVDCDAEQGALFCDGQWVDHGGNLKECVESLRAVLNIEVEGYAEGSCDGNSCEGSAGGSLSCAVEPGGDYGRTGALMGAFGLMAFGFVARRRRA